jgi:hypothetical protein
MKKILVIAIAFALLLLTGCKAALFIPGASIGYFISRGDDGAVLVEYSTDRKEALFSGTITTDGYFTEVRSLRFDDEQVFTRKADLIEFSSRLTESEFADTLVIRAQGHSYLEFDLRINDSYDLNRINIGRFLHNPDEQTFRVDDAYFESVAAIPWYERSPFANLFSKLYSNMVFTALFVIVLGVLIVEALRITVFRTSPKRKLYLIISYTIVALAVVLAYVFLRAVT